MTNPLLTSVATEVAGEFGSKLSRILSDHRGHAEDARARAIAIAVYQRISPVPLTKTDLGVVFGRDRTTVRHALARVDDWQKDSYFESFSDRFLAVVRRVQARQ